MILEVKNLGFGYRKEEKLFEKVNFGVEKGEIFSILGANGIGKSTMMNCIANLLKPTEGEILLEGKPMETLPLPEIARKVGYVPQIHTPAYGYEVRDFVVMGRAPYLGMFRQPSKEDYRMVDQVLEELGIRALSRRPYTEISGGERQQVTIARAIVQQPELIILDEPTNHLDYGNQLRMIELIRKLAEKGYGVIITSHMPDHVLLLGGKVGMLRQDGRLLSGTTEDIITKEHLEELYHVKVHLTYVEEVGRRVCISGERKS